MEDRADNFIQKQGNITHGRQSQKADAIDGGDPDDDDQTPLEAHAQDDIQLVNIRPTQGHEPRPYSASINHDKNADMNNWIIGRAFQPKSAATGAPLPMSARDFTEDDELDRKVQTILAASATNISRGKDRQGLFPYKYVFRGEELKMATMNSLSVSNHCWAIFRMVRDEKVPAHIKPHLVTHIEQVLEDSRTYNWQTAVRPWSNEIFPRVAEGRLSDGWASYNEIQLLRISISQPSTAKIANLPEHQQGFRSVNQNVSNDQLRGGPPCVNFNSQKGCSLQSGHVVNGQKLTHICAFVSSMLRSHAHTPSITVEISSDREQQQPIFSGRPAPPWPKIRVYRSNGGW